MVITKQPTESGEVEVRGLVEGYNITDQNPNEGANKAVGACDIDCALFVDCCICRHSDLYRFTYLC